MKKIKQKQEEANNSEIHLSKFCINKGIKCLKLDNNERQKNIFLKNIDGKCPDFLCTKRGKSIFIEVKTLTNITNKKREDEIEEKQYLFTIPDPVSELKGPFTHYVKDTSKKFKNIKEGFNYPKILLIYGLRFNLKHNMNAIFLGSYDSYDKNNKYLGLKKEDKSIFESTGKSISAVVYYDYENNIFHGIENFETTSTSFSEKDFNLLFGIQGYSLIKIILFFSLLIVTVSIIKINTL